MIPIQLELTDETKKLLALGVGAVGTYHSLKFFGGVVSGAWKHMLRPGHDLKKRYSSAGSEPWVLITGAAMGLGKEYARQLGKMGFSIVSIDKNEEAMQNTAAELGRIGIKVKSLTWDLGKLDGVDSYQQFEEALSSVIYGLDICIVINNAGEFFQESVDEIKVERVYRAVGVNCVAPTLIARLFIPKMLTRLNKGCKCAIINVGGNGGEMQNPHYQFGLFGGTKAFLHCMSDGLREWYGDKIDILTVIPRQTKTRACPVDYCFTGNARGHVRSVLSQLGHETMTYGLMKHDIEVFLRWGNPAGCLFDKMVQWLNARENQKLITTFNGYKD